MLQDAGAFSCDQDHPVRKAAFFHLEAILPQLLHQSISFDLFPVHPKGKKRSSIGCLQEHFRFLRSVGIHPQFHQPAGRRISYRKILHRICPTIRQRRKVLPFQPSLKAAQDTIDKTFPAAAQPACHGYRFTDSSIGRYRVHEQKLVDPHSQQGHILFFHLSETRRNLCSQIKVQQNPVFCHAVYQFPHKRRTFRLIFLYILIQRQIGVRLVRLHIEKHSISGFSIDIHIRIS